MESKRTTDQLRLGVRYQGNVVAWNDERGFGYVVPRGSASQLFLHVKAFQRKGRRPVAGDAVTFTLSHDERGRQRASSVLFLGEDELPEPAPHGVWISIGVASLLGLVLLGTYVFVPIGLAYAYFGSSLVTYVAYGLDKRAAKSGAWRVRESHLHFLALACGWPGAMIAQGVFRHKTRKQPFRLVFWGTVSLNILLFCAYCIHAWSHP